MKIGQAPGSSDVLLELTAASGGVGIQWMVEICQSPVCQLYDFKA